VSKQANVVVQDGSIPIEKSPRSVNEDQNISLNESETPESNTSDIDEGEELLSPMPGTFYSAPTPEDPSFVNVGDEVKKGQTLCIIEAMKIMNEIESEYDGTITDIKVNNGDPVEYNQTLFIINPN
jgi:acetyl-CoA carboxylase biotin carboxyl carrier protein